MQTLYRKYTLKCNPLDLTGSQRRHCLSSTCLTSYTAILFDLNDCLLYDYVPTYIKL